MSIYRSIDEMEEKPVTGEAQSIDGTFDNTPPTKLHETESVPDSQSIDNEHSTYSPTNSSITPSKLSVFSSFRKFSQVLGLPMNQLSTTMNAAELSTKSTIDEIRLLKENEAILNETIKELVAENESLRERLSTYEELIHTLTEEQSNIPTPARHYSTPNTAVHNNIEWKRSPAEYTALQHELSDTQDELASVQAELDSIRFHSKIGDLIRLPPERNIRKPEPINASEPETASLDLAQLLQALSCEMGPLPTDEMSLTRYHDSAVRHLRAMCDRRLPRHMPVSGAKASLSEEELEKVRYGFVVEDEVAVWMAAQM